MRWQLRGERREVAGVLRESDAWRSSEVVVTVGQVAARCWKARRERLARHCRAMPLETRMRCSREVPNAGEILRLGALLSCLLG